MNLGDENARVHRGKSQVRYRTNLVPWKLEQGLRKVYLGAAIEQEQIRGHRPGKERIMPCFSCGEKTNVKVKI
jgi:hypothetical protein